VIFADVRGSTALGEKLSPGEFAALINRFYRVAMDSLLPQKAHVGKVGTGEVNNFTALGDTVNTGARLQSHTKTGQIVVSEGVFSAVADRFTGVPAETIEVRGRGEGYGVRVITPFG
jgi:class 3 adenylate cyclase